jgi:hyperosmotically inducible periplasmic protein
MKALYSISIMVSALVLLVFSTPAHASKMDSRIELSAKQSYVFKTCLQDDDIKIRSSNGAVTLTGIVSENFHKSLAQKTVASLPGVKSVDNRLESIGASPIANSDAWLSDKVKVTLLFHHSASSITNEIDVQDGIVTLRGDIASQAQKDLTTEYTKAVEGITGVHNEMIVTKTLKTTQTASGIFEDASGGCQDSCLLK